MKVAGFICIFGRLLDSFLGAMCTDHVKNGNNYLAENGIFELKIVENVHVNMEIRYFLYKKRWFQKNAV